jgi:hypothetical protein
VLRKADGELGIDVPFDPARLITEVVVGPRERPWFADLVRGALKKYGLSCKITISNRLTPR